MASSTLNKPNIRTITGTLGSDTGDYTIPNAIPNGYKVISGRWFTSYSQYRPLQVGQNGTTLIVQGAGASMENRPYELFLYGGG